MTVCHEGAQKQLEELHSATCCTKDEGGPLGIAIQVEISNHPKML